MVAVRKKLPDTRTCLICGGKKDKFGWSTAAKIATMRRVSEKMEWGDWETKEVYDAVHAKYQCMVVWLGNRQDKK